LADWAWQSSLPYIFWQHSWAGRVALSSLYYENWLFQIFIFFCALFHAINGLRITILDLIPKLIEHQREAIWIEWAVFLPTFGIATLVIINTALGG
jgi:succinate dehydrogenase/fumarate reductase cytochrome b subunit